MTSFGLTLSSEEHPPRRLVELGALAEEHGFDFVSISDHFHPWVDAQGHSPFVWSVLGALAERTSRIDVAVGVTCPIMRIHPAVLAQAAATTGQLLDGRFTWGVGTGEALNEHITGQRWPIAPDRIDMLEEAIDVIRRAVDRRGGHLPRRALHGRERPYLRPARPTTSRSSSRRSRPQAAKMAAASGDGLWTGGDADVIATWKEAGGAGPVYSQISLCWGADEDAAVETGPSRLAQQRRAGSAQPGPADADPLRAGVVDRDQGHDQELDGLRSRRRADRHEIRDAIDSGVDHVYLHQIGDDQEGFCKVWSDEIAPAVSG